MRRIEYVLFLLEGKKIGINYARNFDVVLLLYLSSIYRKKFYIHIVYVYIKRPRVWCKHQDFIICMQIMVISSSGISKFLKKVNIKYVYPPSFCNLFFMSLMIQKWFFFSLQRQCLRSQDYSRAWWEKFKRLGNFFSNCHIALLCHPHVALNCIWMDDGGTIFFCLKTCSDFPIVIFSNLGGELLRNICKRYIVLCVQFFLCILYNVLLLPSMYVY